MVPCISYCPWYCHSKGKVKVCILWRGGGVRGHVLTYVFLEERSMLCRDSATHLSYMQSLDD